MRTSVLGIIFFSVCVLALANANDDLLKAASQKNAEGVKAAIAKGARVGVTGQQARTALHIAAANGSLDIVGILLDAKAPLTARDSDGLTPLLRAAKSLQGATVELLLRRGADENSLLSLLGVKDSAGQTLLHAAAQKGIVGVA